MNNKKEKSKRRLRKDDFRDFRKKTRHFWMAIKSIKKSKNPICQFSKVKNMELMKVKEKVSCR